MVSGIKINLAKQTLIGTDLSPLPYIADGATLPSGACQSLVVGLEISFLISVIEPEGLAAPFR